MRKCFKVFFFIAIVLAALLLCEIVARLYFRHFFKKYPLPVKLSTIPGVPYVANDLPIPVFSKKKRIVVIGDHISRHRSKQNRMGYLDLLVQMSGDDYEMINTSAAFYSLPEEMSMLDYSIQYYQPHIIIVTYVFNDLFTYYRRYPLTLLFLSKSDLFSGMIRLPALRVATNMIFRMRPSFFSTRRYKETILNTIAQVHESPSFVMLRRFLVALKNAERDHGIRSVFVIIPPFIDFNDHRFLQAHERVLSACREEEITCIDMLDIFKPLGLTAVKEDDGDIWHQNALGNELIAERLKMVIQGYEQN